MFIKQKEKESKEATLPLPLSPKTVSAFKKNKNVLPYSSIAKFCPKMKYIPLQPLEIWHQPIFLRLFRALFQSRFLLVSI